MLLLLLSVMVIVAVCTKQTTRIVHLLSYATNDVLRSVSWHEYIVLGKPLYKKSYCYTGSHHFRSYYPVSIDVTYTVRLLINQFPSLSSYCVYSSKVHCRLSRHKLLSYLNSPDRRWYTRLCGKILLLTANHYLVGVLLLFLLPYHLWVTCSLITWAYQIYRRIVRKLSFEH